MMAASPASKRTLSPLQIGLLVVIALLAVSVEAMILRAYHNSVSTAAFFQQTSYGGITNLSNVQREALFLHLETDQFLQDPRENFKAVSLRRSVLLNQIHIQTAQSRNNPQLSEAMAEIKLTLDEYDALLAQLESNPDLAQTDMALQVKEVLIRLERQVKAVYDSEEINFFEATSVALQA